MEEKIVGNKMEGSSFSRSLSLSCIYLISHPSTYLVCLRSTTPLWFTDNTGSCVRFERAILDWPVRSLRKTPVEWYGLKQTTTEEQHPPGLSTRYGLWEASRPRTRASFNGVKNSPRSLERAHVAMEQWTR